MNQKNIEHIALYSLVLVGTLVVGVLARQFVLSKGIDDFSSTVAFFATVIVLMAIYASLQTTFNQFLLPRIEAFLLRFSAFKTMKNHNDTISVPEAPTIKDSNQATPDVIESAPTAEETISKPSEYEVIRTNAITEKNRAIQTKLEKVISYTKQTMVAYMSEEDINRLCTYVAEYSTGDTLQKISPVKVDSQLKSIDIMHFGWNIGKAFGRKRIHTATFIKNVFAYTLRDLEISTIERKMSHTETDSYIKLNKNICLSLT
ncbi:mobilization protein [Bacteroides uniformis]|uniref:mobilization protein n=1 Tax=Bacteroides uniformis TaxID=820 RepID=UPI0039B400BE